MKVFSRILTHIMRHTQSKIEQLTAQLARLEAQRSEGDALAQSLDISKSLKSGAATAGKSDEEGPGVRWLTLALQSTQAALQREQVRVYFWESI
jgi:hypothetical protein